MSAPEAAAASVGRPRRALATVVGLVFVDLVGFGVIIPILPFYVRSFGVSDVAIGLLVALAGIPFTPAVGGLLPALGGPGWFTGDLVALLVVLGLLSVGFGLLAVSLSTLVSLGASAETQGTAFGVTRGAGSLGRTVGPPAMAALYVVAIPWPFLVGAVLVVPVLAILAGLAGAEWTRASTADRGHPRPTDGRTCKAAGRRWTARGHLADRAGPPAGRDRSGGSYRQR